MLLCDSRPHENSSRITVEIDPIPSSTCTCVCVCVHACVYLHRVFGSRLVLEKRSSLVQAGEKRTFNKYFFYDNLVAAAYNLKRVRRSARGGIESIVDWETGGIISFRMVV